MKLIPQNSLETWVTQYKELCSQISTMQSEIEYLLYFQCIRVGPSRTSSYWCLRMKMCVSADERVPTRSSCKRHVPGGTLSFLLGYLACCGKRRTDEIVTLRPPQHSFLRDESRCQELNIPGLGAEQGDEWLTAPNYTSKQEEEGWSSGAEDIFVWLGRDIGSSFSFKSILHWSIKLGNKSCYLLALMSPFDIPFGSYQHLNRAQKHTCHFVLCLGLHWPAAVACVYGMPSSDWPLSSIIHLYVFLYFIIQPFLFSSLPYVRCLNSIS